MKFHWGPIPESADFKPEPPWQPLRWDPDPKWMNLIALPVAAVNFVMFSWLWRFCKLNVKAAVLTLGWQLMIMGVLIFLVLIAVHEFVHMLAHPQAGRSELSVLGCYPRYLLFYAHYHGELSRERFLAVFLMPLLILSVLPLIVAAVFPGCPEWVSWISIVNATMACGDVIGALIIMVQVPGQAQIRNLGWKTYWKAAGNS